MVVVLARVIAAGINNFIINIIITQINITIQISVIVVAVQVININVIIVTAILVMIVQVRMELMIAGIDKFITVQVTAI